MKNAFSNFIASIWATVLNHMVEMTQQVPNAMPCAVCACEASSTFSHVLESKEGIKLKKAHLDLFTETCSILIYIILNPNLRGKKANLMGPTKKR